MSAARLVITPVAVVNAIATSTLSIVAAITVPIVAGFTPPGDELPALLGRHISQPLEEVLALILVPGSVLVLAILVLGSVVLIRLLVFVLVVLVPPLVLGLAIFVPVLVLIARSLRQPVEKFAALVGRHVSQFLEKVPVFCPMLFPLFIVAPLERSLPQSSQKLATTLGSHILQFPENLLAPLTRSLRLGESAVFPALVIVLLLGRRVRACPDESRAQHESKEPERKYLPVSMSK